MVLGERIIDDSPNGEHLLMMIGLVNPLPNPGSCQGQAHAAEYDAHSGSCRLVVATKNIVEIALDVYEEAEKQGINIQGPERESMAAEALYIACKKAGNARSLKEFEDASVIPKKKNREIIYEIAAPLKS
ncbi:hypothetical protein PsorP6_001023 [Peronosclerospora sorghi]|uniref:Uncharacterized protein n=1 Tax=Peronosclerospora sorghi TaxID=230839 RepID=A0ACC0WW37_9STRA|nr:hypothetical protein PsorP6_001023 [Peronosclerospora sorghi]